ncbi:MAG TPA: hypothetical protein VFU21_17805 [Kofleriaceae bacterium]|nr:hypothetical protein [Kofleriaceae bacterium]
MRMIVIVALVAAAGCAASDSKRADLVADIRGYGDGLRWRDFNAAALRIVPDHRPAFMDHCEQLAEDLRIADWEMRRMTYSDDRNRAEVHVEWTWLLDSRGIVHTTVTRQEWARHGKQWILHREERLRGEPMPGVAEPKRNRRPAGPRNARR